MSHNLVSEESFKPPINFDVTVLEGEKSYVKMHEGKLSFSEDLKGNLRHPNF